MGRQAMTPFNWILNIIGAGFFLFTLLNPVMAVGQNWEPNACRDGGAGCVNYNSSNHNNVEPDNNGASQAATQPSGATPDLGQFESDKNGPGSGSTQNADSESTGDQNLAQCKKDRDVAIANCNGGGRTTVIGASGAAATQIISQAAMGTGNSMSGNADGQAIGSLGAGATAEAVYESCARYIGVCTTSCSNAAINEKDQKKQQRATDYSGECDLKGQNVAQQRNMAMIGAAAGMAGDLASKMFGQSGGSFPKGGGGAFPNGIPTGTGTLASVTPQTPGTPTAPALLPRNDNLGYQGNPTLPNTPQASTGEAPGGQGLQNLPYPKGPDNKESGGSDKSPKNPTLTTSNGGGGSFPIGTLGTDGVGRMSGNRNDGPPLDLNAFLPCHEKDPNPVGNHCPGRGLASDGSSLQAQGVSGAFDLSNWEKISRKMAQKRVVLKPGDVSDSGMVRGMKPPEAQ